jgi:hypothetical protein
VPRKKAPEPPPDQPTPKRPAIVLRLAPNKFAVAVWQADEDGEPVYEIAHEDILDVSVAATLGRTAV